MRITVGLAVVAFLGAAAPAGAADQTYTLDDLPAGTVVSNQYAGRGLTFGPSVAGQRQSTASLPSVATVGASAAASGSNVGRVQRTCFSAECVGTAESWASFSAGQARVSVSAGAFGTASNTLTMTAFNAAGAQVGQSQASVPGGVFRTKLSISATSASIRFVRIRGSTLGTFGIDSLFASTSPSTGPDFSISIPFGTHVIEQGKFVDVPVTVTRRNSSGTIRISASGLPSGATATPVDHTLSTASPTVSSTTVNLRLSASATAPPATDRDITVTATPLSAAAGEGSRSQLIRVRLLVFFDVRVIAVEPTQGIQTNVFSAPVSVGVQRYRGVPLQSLGRTVVRVYANTPRGGQPVPGTSARLFGFDAAGNALPGSPLFPDGGSRTVPAAVTSLVSFAERTNPNAAFTFTLPLSWTGQAGASPQPAFATRLQAVIEPPIGSVAFRECGGCTGNDSLTLADVNYQPTCCVTVASAVLTAQGASLPRNITAIMTPALTLFPLQIALKPFEATIDLTDAVTRDASGAAVVDRPVAAERLMAFNERTGQGEAVLGVLSPELPDAFAAPPYGIFSDIADQPLTRAGRQLGHALGRPVASSSCGGSGEAWPPDETGLIQGFGLDRRSPSPYRLFATPPELASGPGTLPASAGEPRAFYDLMSSCATAGNGDPNTWISVKGWGDLLARWQGGGPASAARKLLQAAGRLHVNAALELDGSVRVLSVRPLSPATQSGGFETGYRLVVRDSSGALLAETPMRARAFATRGAGAGPTILQATAPADPAAARVIEIVRDGAIVARRERTAGVPTGRFLSPRRGQLVGRTRRLSIRFEAADPDADKLESTIEWSARGGRPGTWRTIFVGPSGGSVALPSEYFAGSSEARLRLRLSDGFNETVIPSAPFRTIHRRPTVRIESPRIGSTFRRDTRVSLSATAMDERQERISSSRLRWYSGRRLIARGNGAVVTLGGVGSRRIRAEVTDATGRRGSATIRVRVVAVAPELRVLSAPGRISLRTRRVRLRVSSSLAARLVIHGGGVRPVRAAVSAAPRVIRVPIRPSVGLVKLRLRAVAGGRGSTTVVEIDRR